MPPAKDYYRLLQVDPAAPIEAIEAAYRRLAREAHPDLNDSPDATRRITSPTHQRSGRLVALPRSPTSTSSA